MTFGVSIMHILKFLVCQAFAQSDLPYTYYHLNTTLATVPQANVTCNGEGLTYFTFKQLLSEDEGRTLDDACADYSLSSSASSPILDNSLQFYRQELHDAPTVISKEKMLTVEETLQRRITMPVNHASCLPGGNIRCIPGPCRIWEYDYQARNTLTGLANSSDADNVELIGKPVCGPVFGIQAASFAGLQPATVPSTVDSQTLKMFPSLQSTGAPDLTDMNEHRVPIVPNSSINLNPVYYYKTPLAHKFGSENLKDLASVTCEKQKAPFLVPTLQSRWGYLPNDNTNTAHLGLLDINAAMEASSADLKQIAYNSPDTFMENPYNNIIPQLMVGSLYEQNQSFNQAKYEDTCDLSQCSWLPVVDDATDKNNDDLPAETCFMAEMFALYRNITDWMCDEQLSGAYTPECKNTTDRIMISNPGSFLPEYCFAPGYTLPQKPTETITSDCSVYPFLRTDANNPDCMNISLTSGIINFVCADSTDPKISGVPKPQTNTIGYYKSYQIEQTRKCSTNASKNNFKNMSDIYFRWPLNYLFQPPETTLDYYTSNQGFYSAQYNGVTDNEDDAVHPIPMATSPRILPLFKCGPRESPSSNYFSNNFKDKNRLNKREFGYCFQNWKNSVSSNLGHTFGNLLTCLIDYGLVRSSRGKERKINKNLKRTDSSIQMQILSLLTYIFGSIDVENSEFRGSNLPKDINLENLFNSDTLQLFMKKNNVPANFVFDVFDSSAMYTTSQLYKPVPQAIVDDRKYKAKSPMLLNASFLNDAEFSESHACNCGNSPVIYAFEGIPLEYQPDIFARGNTFAKSSDTNTWLMHVGYSWLSNTMPDELSIGLYMQGNPSYTDNFTIVERDFLDPGDSNNTVADLAERYYLGSIAPLPEPLINELQFADLKTLQRSDPTLLTPLLKLENVTSAYNGAGAEFKVRQTLFNYGSCVRYPYGQLSMMELDSAAQTYFYGTADNVDNQMPHVEQYKVGIESLMGYCENVADDTATQTQYAYCFGDPKYNHRAVFCQKKAAQYNVIGKAVNERQIVNVCNQVEQYCFYIPGDPLYPTLNDILINNQITDMSGYTILVSPFNFTVARFLLGPETYYYKVGGGGDVGDTSSSILIPDNTFIKEIYGIDLLSEEEFNVLTGNWAIANITLDKAITLITSITAKINATRTNGVYSWPALQINSNTTDDAFVYPELSETNTKVAHSHLTIRSAIQDGLIRFKQDPVDQSSSITCNRFLVSSPGFILQNTFVDQQFCSSSQEIDTAVVLFGGSDVSNSQLTLGSTYAITPVVFAGDDSIMFQKLVGANVNASNVMITYTNTDFIYALAAARTFTKQNITMHFMNAPDKTFRIIIQPISSAGNSAESLFGVTTNATIEIVNISKYTSVFSNAVLQAEFPLRNVSRHINYILFISLVSGLAFFVIKFAVQVWHALHETDIEETVESNFTITKRFGTTIAINRHTNEYWNAHDLRSRVVAKKLGNIDTGAPKELQTYLFNSHFKNE